MLSQVSPFRYPHLNGYLLLNAAFRSLSRLSSAPSAKAFALRSSLSDLNSVASVITYVMTAGSIELNNLNN